MPLAPPRRITARNTAVVFLALVVIGIIGVAFRGSWGALRDAALAAHLDGTSAALYPFAVDGLLIVAIVSAVLLRHDQWARWYCLGIIAAYTGASWLMNFLHGLGLFGADPVTGQRPVPPWPVVAVIATLVIGSIFLGSHLLVYVGRHLFPQHDQTVGDRPVICSAAPLPWPTASHDGTAADRGDTDDPRRRDEPETSLEAAKRAYRASLGPGMKPLSQRAMEQRYRITRREAAQVQREIDRELGRGTAEDDAPAPVTAPARHTDNGHGPAEQHAATGERP